MGRNIINSNLLQCPECGEIFEAPPEIFLRDDFLSKALLEFSIKCSKCTQPSHSSQMRHITDTFQSILMYCKNRVNGCTKELPSCDLPTHEINCDYRPVRCIWHLQCEKEISFCEYRKHLEKTHQPYIKKVHLNEEYDVVIKDLKDHVVKVSSVVCDEKKQLYFTRRCCIDLQENTFMVCVHYIGKREDAKKFVYRVRIHQGIDSLNAFYEYSAYCAPCVERPNAPDCHAHCFILQPKKIFLTDDYLTELKYSVTIKHVKNIADT